MNRARCGMIALGLLLVGPALGRAESGYVSVREAITGSVGAPVAVTSGELPDAHTVTILFYPTEDQVILWGKNEQDEVEGTLWETDQCALLFGGYCGSWSALCDSLDEGYRLNIILQSDDSGDADSLLLIDTAEKAQIMYEAMLDNMNG